MCAVGPQWALLAQIVSRGLARLRTSAQGRGGEATAREPRLVLNSPKQQVPKAPHETFPPKGTARLPCPPGAASLQLRKGWQFQSATPGRPQDSG